MLRACLAAGTSSGQVSAVLEPIALYHERDLYEAGDRQWLARYDPSAVARIAEARSYGSGTDLTIVTFGNGVRMSLRVARRLERDGIHARVLDLRWVLPLPMPDVFSAAAATGRILIADETRHSGGVGEGVVSGLVEAGFDGLIARVASRDSYVPLGTAASLVLLSEDDIEQAARRLVSR
jgi:2-oxoisovalerate dehydrogenase E1 component